MSHFQIVLFASLLVLLILLSGFFSAAETGLMAINRYRLRHRAHMKKRAAILILKLLKRPDRLLGMILIGNNCANIIASALATLLAINLFGEKSVILSTVILTFVILIFSEVAPKTVAAIYPERIAKLVAWPVYWLLMIFYPVVWVLNGVTNGLLRLLGVNLTSDANEPLSREELRSVVYETSGRISHKYQSMLLGILDLNKITVADVMIPHHEIIGIDLEFDWHLIQLLLAKSDHDWLPVYRESINQIVGILHLRDLMRDSLSGEPINKDKLVKILHEPYFVPEATQLNIQLMNFQRQRKRIALVVDEYGEIQGLVTLEDILEEIVGEFTTTVTSTGKMMEVQSDGSYLIDGGMTIRELNRITEWSLPIKGARTLNGLIIDQLETIPKSGICVKIAGYPIEIIEVKEKRVKIARVFPRLTHNA